MGRGPSPELGHVVGLPLTPPPAPWLARGSQAAGDDRRAKAWMAQPPMKILIAASL